MLALVRILPKVGKDLKSRKPSNKSRRPSLRKLVGKLSKVIRKLGKKSVSDYKIESSDAAEKYTLGFVIGIIFKYILQVPEYLSKVFRKSGDWIGEGFNSELKGERLDSDYRVSVVEYDTESKDYEISSTQEDLMWKTSKSNLVKAHNIMSIKDFGTDWEGKVGTYTTKSGLEFVKFSDPYYSIRAAVKSIERYPEKYGAETLEEIINKYVTWEDEGNNPNLYARQVSERSGIGLNEVVDLKDREHFKALVREIAMRESSTILSDDYLDRVYEAYYGMGPIPLQSEEFKVKNNLYVADTSIYNKRR